MTLTPEQQVKIRKKEECTPEALKRDPLSNYREGYFHVTLNTRGEAPVLSSIVGNVDGEGPCAPHCEYTELGNRVKRVIASIPDFHKWTIVIESEVMPDHIHMLLHLQPGGKEHLGKVIGGFMGGCSHAYWDVLGIDWRKDHPTQERNSKAGGERSAAAQRVPDRDRDHTRSFRGPSLFVRGYNDMEAITDDEVEIKRQYIRNNPRKRLIQGYRHECFQKHRNRHSRNWTLDRVMNAVAAAFSHNTEKLAMAQKAVKARLNADERGIALDYIGNVELLSSEKKLPLVCHRADANLFDAQKEAVINAARNGFVIVSAFISQKERDIKQLLIAEQLSFVEIIDNGIAEKYKGVGKSFYALAERKLCQITPWNYRYEKDVKVSREMCMVMNELARVICGKNDDWWK